MKVLFQDYTFNAATKQITFNTTESVKLENILVITNVTDNIIIYNFADPLKGGVLVGNLLTLTYNTTTMSNADSLQVFLDYKSTPSTDESIVLLRRLIQLLTPIGVQDSQQRQRVNVEVVGGGVINTVQNISNLQTYNNIPSTFPIIDQARNTFANGIRKNLTY